MISAPKKERAIAVWLFIICAMIFAMVLLGGVTRLTHSGLSMVEWRPLFGILPPIGEAAWQLVFEQYQQFPEYQKINFTMTQAEFKRIFLFEYSHRVLGRAIGVVFAVPFLYFLLRRRISWRLAPRLGVMFVLGGLQGLLGWYMVQSGLVDRPDVSAYRLTAHLGLAVLIYGYIFWTALGLLAPQPQPQPQPPTRRTPPQTEPGEARSQSAASASMPPPAPPPPDDNMPDNPAGDPLPPAAPAGGEVDVTLLRSQWPRIVAEVRQRQPSAGNFLQDIVDLRLSGGQLTLLFPPTARFGMGQVGKAHEAVSSAIEVVTGARFHVKCGVDEGDGGPGSTPGHPNDAPPPSDNQQRPPNPVPKGAATRDDVDPSVRSVLDAFDGEIV